MPSWEWDTNDTGSLLLSIVTAFLTSGLTSWATQFFANRTRRAKDRAMENKIEEADTIQFDNPIVVADL
jgi:hypothetical protein